MKTIFTQNFKILFVLLFIISTFTSNAQTKHIVEVTNNKYTPKNLTISAGDTVEWQNNEGRHNVNGTTLTYSSNPESFGNSLGFNWTYSHVFNTPGSYNYQCDPHLAFGMVGTIEVQTTTSIEKDLIAGALKMYPNPAKEKVFIEYENFSSPNVTVKFYDLTGKIIFSEMYSSNNRLEINTSQMVSGIYFIELSDATNRKMLKLIKE